MNPARINFPGGNNEAGTDVPGLEHNPHRPHLGSLCSGSNRSAGAYGHRGLSRGSKAAVAWAGRMKAAHANAVENLVVFATLVLVANAVGISNNIAWQLVVR